MAISLSSENPLTSDQKFSVLVSFFEFTKAAKSDQKRQKFRRFIDTFGNPRDYFSAIRLILPSIDRERGNYGLKESILATTLIDALGMSRDSDDAKKLLGWKKGGSKVAGELAGNFSAVAGDVIVRRQSSFSGGLTIGQVNEILDRLASVENRESKVGVLGELIRKTNSREMIWIIKIILKDMKLGISEKNIFHEFHRDAEDLFNVTCDLRFVCEKLCDRNVRHKRQDIEVGKPVIPQMADRASSCEEAWKRLHGKELVVECKFDGERIQVHKNGDNVFYYSRNYINHDEYGCALNNVIFDNVLSERCILDGEMCSWDKGSNRFANFGANQEVAKLAREGVDSDKQLCYVVFDVLYVGDTSVIHQSLKERQELLRKFVRPVKGRLEIVLPSENEGLNAHRVVGDPCWSIVVKHVDEVERFFKETVDNREEGIVLKDLGSKWEPGDRTGKWLKLKPDYVRAGADLDGLIIGGYYGAGRRGGQIGQFLIGIAEKTSPNTHPRKFMSFCKVGTGLNDEELDELVTKLKPYFIKYEYPKKSPPSFYQVTNNSKERPDVWVESPDKSFVVTISSDIRMINTDTFAAPYGLRFPRIDRVRYDKPWYECLDVQSFVELVQSSNGTTQRGGDNEGVTGYKTKRGKTAKGEGRKKLSLSVPSHFARTDVSNVKGESRIFSNMVFHLVNSPAAHSANSLHTLVVENGGTFSMNLNDTVTHCVGAESKGIKFEAVKRRGRDVIHYSWVIDCCSKRQLLPLRPNHYLYLSDSSRKKLQEEIDEFSDSYFWDIEVADLKQILCDVNRPKDAKVVDYYRKKYCPREKWCYFHGCRVCLHLVDRFPSSEWEFFLRVAIRRMKVEVSVGGGKVVDNPSEATHIVVVSLPGHEPNFETLLQGFPEDKKRLLRLKRISVVGFNWLEECFKKEHKLPELEYSLKVDIMEESSSENEEGENDVNMKRLSASPVNEEPISLEEQKILTPTRQPRRRRGRLAVSKPPKPKRARVGKRPAKLQENMSNDEFSEEEHRVQPRTIPALDPIKPERSRRARVGKRPAKVQEISSNDELSDEDHHVQSRTIPAPDPIKSERSKRARVGKRQAKLQEIPAEDETSEQELHVQPRAIPEVDLIKPRMPKRVRGRKGIASDDEMGEQDFLVQPRTTPELVVDDHISLGSDHDHKSVVQGGRTLGNFGPEADSVVLGSKPVTSASNVEYKGKGSKFGHDEIKHSLDNAGLVACSENGKDVELFPTLATSPDLIPSLAKTADSSNSVVEDKNLPSKTPKEGSSVVSSVEPVKKKKISYKDLVNQALKK